MGDPTNELRARLDEMGVRYTTDDSNDYEIIEWQGPYNLLWQFVYDPYEEESYGELRLVETGGATHLTPEQAIAATVGNAREPSDSVIERIGRFCTDYAQCLVDSTILGKRNHEFIDQSAAKKAEVVEADLIRELAEDIATVGHSCASCPEMDNQDSYIAHLQSALRWHDEHVPRPTNPRNTCVVLQGEKPPEEVLFVREDGGVTHYLPENAETCKGEIDSIYFESRLTTFKCHSCEWGGVVHERYAGDNFGGTGMPRYCPNCGRRLVSE